MVRAGFDRRARTLRYGAVVFLFALSGVASGEEAAPPEAAGMTAEEWLRSTADLEGAPSSPETPEPAAEAPPIEVPEAPPMPEAEAEIGEAGLPPEPTAEEPLIEEAEMPAMPLAEREIPISRKAE